MADITVGSSNDISGFLELAVPIHCPDCGRNCNATVVSVPRFEQLRRYSPNHVAIGFRCDGCGTPLGGTIGVSKSSNSKYTFPQRTLEIRIPRHVSFDFARLPEEVQLDFREACSCFSHENWNAFAAMSRRTLQSTAQVLGSVGSNKVMNQVKELEQMGVVDETEMEILKQVVLDGHDGAHPHLPVMDEDRAEILLSLMTDVLNQLFVRKALLAEAAALRNDRKRPRRSR